MSEPEVETPDGVGPRLVRGRERIGLSQEQVADRLRLDVRMIAALESGDYGVIGAVVFVRGFLRRYAELVGESPAEIDALYAQRPHAATAPNLTQVSVRPIESGAHRAALSTRTATLVAAVLVGIAVLWWAVASGHRHAAPGSDEAAQVVHIDAAAPGGEPAKAATPASTPAPVPATVTPATTGAVTTPADAPGDPQLATAPRRRLALTFSGECWAEVYDARGMRLYFGFGHAGTVEELSGVPPFRLLLGNAQVVAAVLEGKAVPLPVAAPGARLRISIGGNGAAVDLR